MVATRPPWSHHMVMPSCLSTWSLCLTMLTPWTRRGLTMVSPWFDRYGHPIVSPWNTMSTHGWPFPAHAMVAAGIKPWSHHPGFTMLSANIVSPWSHHGFIMVSPCYHHGITMATPYELSLHGIETMVSTCSCHHHGHTMVSAWSHHG